MKITSESNTAFVNSEMISGAAMTQDGELTVIVAGEANDPYVFKINEKSSTNLKRKFDSLKGFRMMKTMFSILHLKQDENGDYEVEDDES